MTSIDTFLALPMNISAVRCISLQPDIMELILFTTYVDVM